MRNAGGSALPACGRGFEAAIAWGMPSYHVAIPMSVVAIITQSERTWGILFALVPPLIDNLYAHRDISHNAVAEQHIKPYSLQ